MVKTEERLFEKADNGVDSDYVEVIIIELIDDEIGVIADYNENLK